LEQIRYSAINYSDFVKFAILLGVAIIITRSGHQKKEATPLRSSLICGPVRPSRAAAHRDLLSFHHMNVTDTLKITWSHRSDDHDVQEVCRQSIQPFLISREPVTWASCNLATSQRRPYCISVNSHSPVGLVSRQ
jgi:hypothetical protein